MLSFTVQGVLVYTPRCRETEQRGMNALMNRLSGSKELTGSKSSLTTVIVALLLDISKPHLNNALQIIFLGPVCLKIKTENTKKT